MQSYALVRHAHHTHVQTHTQLSICRDSLAGWLLPGISITASFPPLWSDASSASLLYPSLFSISPFSIVFFYFCPFSFCSTLNWPLCMYHIPSLTPPPSPTSFSHTHLLSLSLTVCFSFSLYGWEVVTVCLSCSLSKYLSLSQKSYSFLLFLPKNRGVSSCWAIDEHGTVSVCHWNPE